MQNRPGYQNNMNIEDKPKSCNVVSEHPSALALGAIRSYQKVLDDFFSCREFHRMINEKNPLEKHDPEEEGSSEK